MRDLAIELEDRPGALAAIGRVLGEAGVSIEGGGVFVHDGRGVAHFLFHDDDAERARRALVDAGITVHAVSDVCLQRLRQDIPGQLGEICRLMAAAGVNIEVMYSDHDHQLVRVVDHLPTAQDVAAAWSSPG